MPTRQMMLCLQLTGGYGAQPGSWRLPGAGLSSYVDMDEHVRLARIAERGTLQLVFFADTPVLSGDLTSEAPQFAIDPILVLTAIARETERVGLVSTSSTTFGEPYTIARQLKALDVISHGRGLERRHHVEPRRGGELRPRRRLPRGALRAGGPDHPDRRGALGSWERDAWIQDVPGNRFADMTKIRPVNLQGRYVAARGPLPIPPSEQGQPVIFQAGASPEGTALAGRYADGVYANPLDIESARAQRAALRDAAERAGRDPDEVRMFAGFMPTIAASRRAALARRRALDESIDLTARVGYLSGMVGLPLDPARLDEPVPEALRERAVPNPQDPRSRRAVAVLREGWSLRDVLAHGVIDFHPVVPGTPTDVADHMQEWFEAGACDGFSLAIDAYHDGVETFVDEVVPILQERGLFHTEYEGRTLREHLAVPDRYGQAVRPTAPARAS